MRPTQRTLTSIKQRTHNAGAQASVLNNPAEIVPNATQRSARNWYAHARTTQRSTASNIAHAQRKITPRTIQLHNAAQHHNL